MLAVHSAVLPRLIFAGTIFSSAFALFLVQPIIAKQILPWFGGSAAVWATCMVFFQFVLLAGYAYADWLTRHCRVRTQVLVHAALLLLSLSLLPIIASPAWKPAGDEEPSWLIIRLLVATVGLPYFLLSTTGPLIQTWVSRSAVSAHVYRYFSLSNLASLLALVAYPFVVEPHASTRVQALAWSLLYAAFVVMCAGAALYYWRHHHRLPPAAHATEHVPEGDWDPAWRDYLGWLLPAALASFMLLAVSNHITQNVAAIPFLWVLPLSLYLASFVLCFESDRWYRRGVFLPAAALLLALCAYGLYDGALGRDIVVAVPLYVAGLFSLCMVLHGELARLRPGPRYLTRFYLMLALGGALGGVSVGLLAPRLLPAYYELGLGLVGCCLVALFLFRSQPYLRWGAAALGLLCSSFLGLQVSNDYSGSRVLTRNFYGTLSTLDLHRDDLGSDVRRLFHGAIKHGEQILAPARRRELTSYYGASSGVGLAILNTREATQTVGVIGLGAGTLAAYGRAGDRYRIYEINPEVIALARSEFSFLADSPAQIETVLGDARLALERDPPQRFDVLAVDAFSGDSIPVHLITQEAMQAYLRHLKPDGIIAFHITNRYLWLAPVVDNIARAKGLAVALVRDKNDVAQLSNTDWILVSPSAATLARAPIRSATTAFTPQPGLGVWSDDFNNLFDVLK